MATQWLGMQLSVAVIADDIAFGDLRFPSLLCPAPNTMMDLFGRVAVVKNEIRGGAAMKAGLIREELCATPGDPFALVAAYVFASSL